MSSPENKPVSVDEALHKGAWMLTYPCLILYIGTMIVGFYFGEENDLPALAPISILGGLLIPQIYWSLMVTHWRLWAFGNVRNVRELYKRAIVWRLIHADDSFMTKLEFRSADQKQRLKELEKKFDRPDVFEDKAEIPAESKIYFDRYLNLFELLIMLAIFGAACYLILARDLWLVGLPLLGLGIYGIFTEYRQVADRSAQLIISDEGITHGEKFHPWSEISGEGITVIGTKQRSIYLCYYHNDELEMIAIDDYDTDAESVSELLRIHRGRNEQKNVEAARSKKKRP